jgi:hypothetical protein
MTRKDYEAIAAVIKAVREEPVVKNRPVTQAVVDMLATRLCVTFADDNDRFRKERFLRACGFCKLSGTLFRS